MLFELLKRSNHSMERRNRRLYSRLFSGNTGVSFVPIHSPCSACPVDIQKEISSQIELILTYYPRIFFFLIEGDLELSVDYFCFTERMFAPIYILLLVTSSMMTITGLSLRNSAQLRPVLFPSVTDENGQNRLSFIVQCIMKYISSIGSSEDFIDNILNRQENTADQLKILKFLKNCFRLTDALIQIEIIRLTDTSNTNPKSLFSSAFSLEQLEQAHHELNDLHQVIERRIDGLKSWIPPTMPFLNF